MFSKRIFETDFRTALDEELQRQDLTIKELAERADIPLATLYKISSGDRDLRFSTVKRIVRVLEPRKKEFIGVIAAKFLLDEIEGERITLGERSFQIEGYAANSIDECIVAAIRAQKEGAIGIVCAPVLASIVEKIVDVPVAIIKPKPKMVLDAIDSIAKRI